MTAPPDAGRHLEVIFVEEDTVLEVDLGGADAESEAVVEALLAPDVEESERLFQDVGDDALVRRRR
jgi:hypothetical protein